MAWCLGAVAGCRYVDRVVVAAPNESLTQIEAVVDEYAVSVETDVVEGGASRSQSVRAALESANTTYVVVHDAARPFVTSELIDESLSKLCEFGCDGVVAACKVADTVKKTDSVGRVVETLNRNEIWMVQTPQAFVTKALKNAYADSSDDEIASATDDSLLVEASGGDVRVLEAAQDNVKITTKDDLEKARARLSLQGRGHVTS